MEKSSFYLMTILNICDYRQLGSIHVKHNKNNVRTIDIIIFVLHSLHTNTEHQYT